MVEVVVGVGAQEAGVVLLNLTLAQSRKDHPISPGQVVRLSPSILRANHSKRHPLAMVEVPNPLFRSTNLSVDAMWVEAHAAKCMEHRKYLNLDYLRQLSNFKTYLEHMGADIQA